MDDRAVHLIEAFIKRWSGSGGAERANYQIFLTELCGVLGVPCPEPTRAEIERNAYVFEKTVLFTHPDGSETRRYIDLYKRGCFVLEAKQGVEAEEAGETLSEAAAEHRRLRRKGHGRRGSGRWDDVMLRARGQSGDQSPRRRHYRGGALDRLPAVALSHPRQRDARPADHQGQPQH